VSQGPGSPARSAATAQVAKRTFANTLEHSRTSRTLPKHPEQSRTSRTLPNIPKHSRVAHHSSLDLPCLGGPRHIPRGGGCNRPLLRAPSPLATRLRSDSTCTLPTFRRCILTLHTILSPTTHTPAVLFVPARCSIASSLTRFPLSPDPSLASHLCLAAAGHFRNALRCVLCPAR
jgi:hypothetical protein